MKPGFVKTAVGDGPESWDGTEAQKMAEKIRAKAKLTLNGEFLGAVVIDCLNLDPMNRPQIENVLDSIRNDVPTYQFHFMNYRSSEYRSKQVIRYVRNRFDSETQLSNPLDAVAILENEARQEGSDLCIRSVLAYCYYFGIGGARRQEEAITKYQRGCQSDDVMALYSLGAIHFSAGSFDQAVPLLKKAVEKDNPGAMMLLGSCYQYGHGIEKNENEAFELVRYAADLGNGDT